MILGVAYCQPSTLSVIVDREKFKVDIVVSSSNYAECLSSIKKKDDRIQVIFIEKVSTALQFVKSLDSSFVGKVVIFDTPDSITFSGAHLLDAVLESNSVWKMSALVPKVFNATLAGSDDATYEELISLKEKKFKPFKAEDVSTEVAATAIDREELKDEDDIIEDPVQVDDKKEEDVIDNASSNDTLVGIIEKIPEDQLITFFSYVVGLINSKEATRKLNKDLLDIAFLPAMEQLWVAYYAFIKNDLGTDEAAKFAGCTEDDLNLVIDILDSVNDPVFITKPPKLFGSESTVTTTTAESMKVDIKPEFKPIPTAKPKSFVECIEFAFTNITSDTKELLRESTSNYVTSTKGTKATFNSALNAALKAGADKKIINTLDKMANGDYGNWAWSSYGDMVIYNTSVKDASTLSSVVEEDLNMFLQYCPLANADKTKYEKYLPKWVTQARK